MGVGTGVGTGVAVGVDVGLGVLVDVGAGTEVAVGSNPEAGNDVRVEAGSLWIGPDKMGVAIAPQPRSASRVVAITVSKMRLFITHSSLPTQDRYKTRTFRRADSSSDERRSK